MLIIKLIKINLTIMCKIINKEAKLDLDQKKMFKTSKKIRLKKRFKKKRLKKFEIKFGNKIL